MKNNSRIKIEILILMFFLAAALACTCLSNAEDAHKNAESSSGSVTASVRTDRVERRILTEQLTAYGRIIPTPGSIRTLAVPFESRIQRIFVTEGQVVQKGKPLLELSPSPATLLMFESAKNSLEAAKLQLEKVKERVRMKLATTKELIQAEKEYNQTLLQMKNLKKMKIGEKITINARNNEMVVKPYCRVGQIISTGSPLMEVVDGNMLEAAIGVEPEDAHLLKNGQTVFLTPINREKTGESQGRIITVSRAVNSASMLIDTFIQIQPDSGFLVNEYVKARIVIDRKEGMVVPRSAVLPGKRGFVCFTVKDGRAHKHFVKKGWEGRDYVEIISSSIKPGEQIVITGNYELADGMCVNVVPGSGESSSTKYVTLGQDS